MLIPMGMDKPLVDRPVVAPVVLALLVYQYALGMHFPLDIPVERWVEGDIATFGYWSDFALGMVRGCSSFTLFFLFFFWMMVAPAMEVKVGSPAVVLCLLLGSLVPWLGMRAGFLAWEQYYWPGLGGMMACLGLGYYAAYDEDLNYYYFLLLWWGRGTTAAALLMVVIHLFVPLFQYVGYDWRRGDVAPTGVRTLAWLYLVPLVAVGIAALAGNVLHTLGLKGENGNDPTN